MAPALTCFWASGDGKLLTLTWGVPVDLFSGQTASLLTHPSCASNLCPNHYIVDRLSCLDIVLIVCVSSIHTFPSSASTTCRSARLPHRVLAHQPYPSCTAPLVRGSHPFGPSPPTTSFRLLPYPASARELFQRTTISSAKIPTTNIMSTARPPLTRGTTSPGALYGYRSNERSDRALQGTSDGHGYAGVCFALITLP